MNTKGYSSTTLAILLMALTSAVFTTSSIAQTVTDPNVYTAGTGQGGRDLTITSAGPKVKPIKSATRDRAKLAAYNNAAWNNLLHGQGTCTDPQSTACANDALTLAGSTCSSSALLFQTGTRAWQKWQFALVIASAGFTGVGSAATIAGSTTVPKIFSTLGGTTGLGAVTATTNSNISDNQAGVAAVNVIQGELQKLTSPGPAKGDDPANQAILSQAQGYANQCVAANPVPPTPPPAPTTPVATPTFSPAAGAYTAAQTVTISDATAGSTIYYTTDGSTPTSSSKRYSGAVTVSSTETLKAIATGGSSTSSAIATAVYTINKTGSPAPAAGGAPPPNPNPPQ